MKFGKSYYFQGIEFYVHDPDKPLILMYKTKEFIVMRQNSFLRISARPYSITDKRIINSIKNYIGEKDRIISPGGRTLSYQLLEISDSKEVIYFVLNVDSNAVKIGRTKDIVRRLKSLQSANPVKLILLKTIEVSSTKKAKAKEFELQMQFQDFKIRGEWFVYNSKLKTFINNL